jgi:hypothetical protein
MPVRDVDLDQWAPVMALSDTGERDDDGVVLEKPTKEKS